MEALEQAKQRQKYLELTTQPVQRLVCKLALPTIVTMVVMSLYNMTDTYFVGRISTEAVAAVGVCYPVTNIIQAGGFFFGQGSGNYISREFGRQNLRDCEIMAATGFCLAIITGVILTGLALLFVNPFARLLGATDTLLVETTAYLKILLLGAPVMMASIVLNVQYRFQGNSVSSMLGIALGAVINIALDPLLILVFRLGVRGAAIATVVSQLCSLCVLLPMSLTRGNTRIRLRQFHASRHIVRELFRGGTPSLLRQSFASVATASLNNMAGAFGVAAVAAMSVVSRIMSFCASVLIGFGQGFQPVCGFNYGAKRFERVKSAFRFSLTVACAVQLAIAALGFIFAPRIIALFRESDPDVILYGARALRFQCVTFPLTALLVMTNMLTQTMGQIRPAALLAVARQGLYFIPLVLILPRCFGLTGVLLSQPCSDLLSFLTTVIILVFVLRTLSDSTAARETDGSLGGEAHGASQ